MLTPLHFEHLVSTGALYGRHTYYTDCGRFQIARNDDGRWTVTYDWEHEHSIEWGAWLRDNGFNDASFSTRKAAVRRLKDELEADGCYAAEKPVLNR